MTTQGLTDGQRFCERCGTVLDRGRCPVHEYGVSALGASSSGVTRPPLRVAPRPSYAEARPYGARPASTDDAATVTIASTPPPIHNIPSSVRAAPSERTWQPAPQSAPDPRPTKNRSAWAAWIVAGLAALLLVALIGDHLYLQGAIDSNHRALSQLDQRLSAQLAAMNALAGKVGTLETQSSDPAVVAAAVRASVYTVETPDGLGSGWVVSSSGGSSSIITDYHVVDLVWTSSGAHTVQVRQDTKTLTGTITKVDKGDDLAVVTVKAALAPLARATTIAMIGDAVLVVGSPLGLSGTVANGIVSSFRSGLIQFSAPISPGDSGGPVVNRRGQVIGVAESKLTGSGVEGLSFAIPISTVCSTVITC